MVKPKSVRKHGVIYINYFECKERDVLMDYGIKWHIYVWVVILGGWISVLGVSQIVYALMIWRAERRARTKKRCKRRR